MKIQPLIRERRLEKASDTKRVWRAAGDTVGGCVEGARFGFITIFL